MTEPEIPHGELADDQDQLDWNIARDGRMRDHATSPDDEPATEPYHPDAD